MVTMVCVGKKFTLDVAVWQVVLILELGVKMDFSTTHHTDKSTYQVYCWMFGAVNLWEHAAAL
jgi:hypothetical protein